jgi:hypothetical protein
MMIFGFGAGGRMNVLLEINDECKSFKMDHDDDSQSALRYTAKF